MHPIIVMIPNHLQNGLFLTYNHDTHVSVNQCKVGLYQISAPFIYARFVLYVLPNAYYNIS